MSLVLSIFPGIGILDVGFEEAGFCVVRGPDVIWGGDIRKFHPPGGRFDGIIGGPPCQSFSPIGNVNKARYGEASVMPDLVPEFERVVSEVEPKWWVMENSTHCPGTKMTGHRLEVDNEWLGQPQRRRRAFWSNLNLARFLMLPALLPPDSGSERTVCSADSVDWRGSRSREPKRTLADNCELQGLPREFFAHRPFTVSAAKRMVGNAVPLPMARAIADAVVRALGLEAEGIQ